MRARDLVPKDESITIVIGAMAKGSVNHIVVLYYHVSVRFFFSLTSAILTRQLKSAVFPSQLHWLVRKLPTHLKKSGEFYRFNLGQL